MVLTENNFERRKYFNGFLNFAALPFTYATVKIIYRVRIFILTKIVNTSCNSFV